VENGTSKHVNFTHCARNQISDPETTSVTPKRVFGVQNPYFRKHKLTLTCRRASSGLNWATESSCWSTQALTASLASRYCFHNLTASWYRLHKSKRDWQVPFHAVTASCTAASIFWLTSGSHEDVNGSAAALSSSRRSSRWSKDPYRPWKSKTQFNTMRQAVVKLVQWIHSIIPRPSSTHSSVSDKFWGDNCIGHRRIASLNQRIASLNHLSYQSDDFKQNSNSSGVFLCYEAWYFTP
jgi:hypothetical protein